MAIKEQAVRTVELEEYEKDFLLELFTTAEKELLTELGRTDTREYRAKLEKRLDLLRNVRAKITGA